MTDYKTTLFDGQAVTNADVKSTILDVGDIEDVGKGPTKKFINVEVDTAFSEDSSGEYMRIDLIASSGADPATSDKIMEILPSTAVSTGSALLSKGPLLSFPIPPGVLNGYDRFGIAVIVTSALATGKLNARVDLDSNFL